MKGQPREPHLVEALGEVGVDGLNQLVQGRLVLLADVGEGQGSGGLLANDCTKTGLALSTGEPRRRAKGQNKTREAEIKGVK
jgi:hypothetical protein